MRELRQNLSVYLARIAEGETLEVTDRGQPVAILAPIRSPVVGARTADGGRTRRFRPRAICSISRGRAARRHGLQPGQGAGRAARRSSAVSNAAVYLDSSALIKLVFEEDESDGTSRISGRSPATRVEYRWRGWRCCAPSGRVDGSRRHARRAAKCSHAVHLIRPDDAMLAAAARDRTVDAALVRLHPSGDRALSCGPTSPAWSSTTASSPQRRATPGSRCGRPRNAWCSMPRMRRLLVIASLIAAAGVAIHGAQDADLRSTASAASQAGRA